MKAFQALILVSAVLTPLLKVQADTVYEVMEANGSVTRLTADEFYKVTSGFQSLTNDITNTSDQYTGRIKYMNPRNSANVMAQWRVIDSLFRTNNIRTGITMCSLSCSGDLHRDDVEQAKRILNDAIRKKLIDNSILKMEIRAQEN